MIKIDRDRLDDQGRRIRPDEEWFELARKSTEIAKEERDRHVIRELVYRHRSVKMALEELFHRKCAYCETSLEEVPWQVEHFRPKKAVTERPDHPGYYWLAYEWFNLYPSCAACNQRLKDQPLWGDPEIGKAAGKANQFPVEDELKRAMSHEDDLGLERPLLLDPCQDDPEKSFLYNPLGEILSADGDRRAETSIRIFHLIRRRLRDRRKERIEAVTNLLKIIHDRQSANDATAVKDFKDFLRTFYLSDFCEYAGAARFVLSDPDAFAV